MTSNIKHKAVERIWLIPDAIDGELGYVWCDDPAPGEGMNPEDAVEYVRKDAHDARVAELEQERDDLAAHVDRLKTAEGKRNAAHAAKAKAEEAELAAAQELDEAKAECDALAAHVERLRDAAKPIRHELAQWALTEQDPETSAAMCQFDQVSRETPTTSLAHRDLLKQAEGFEALADKLAWGVVVDHLLEAAKGLRQRANQLEKKPCQS